MLSTKTVVTEAAKGAISATAPMVQSDLTNSLIDYLDRTRLRPQAIDTESTVRVTMASDTAAFQAADLKPTST